MKDKFRINKLNSGRSSRIYPPKCMRIKKVRNYIKLVSISTLIVGYADGVTKYDNSEIRYSYNSKPVISTVIKDIMRKNILYEDDVLRFISISHKDLYNSERSLDLHRYILFKINLYDSNGNKIRPIGFDNDYRRVLYKVISNDDISIVSLHDLCYLNAEFIYDKYDRIPEVFILENNYKIYV